MTKTVSTVLLGVVTVLWLAALLPLGGAAMMSPMAFDSGESPHAWTVLIVLGLSPFVVIAALIASWTAFAFNSRRWAWIMMAAPVVWLAVGFAVFATL